MNPNKQKLEAYLLDLMQEGFNSFPTSILEFWSTHYGMELNKVIADKNGNNWTVDRILTVDTDEDAPAEPISWRHNNGPEALDYSLPYLESILPNWEEDAALIPMMAINSNENSTYDLVVLDLSNATTPKLSIWVHDDSADDTTLFDLTQDLDEFLNGFK